MMLRELFVIFALLAADASSHAAFPSREHATKTGSLNIPEKIIGGVIDIVQSHKQRPAKPGEGGSGGGAGGGGGGAGDGGGGYYQHHQQAGSNQYAGQGYRPQPYPGQWVYVPTGPGGQFGGGGYEQFQSGSGGNYQSSQTGGGYVPGPPAGGSGYRPSHAGGGGPSQPGQTGYGPSQPGGNGGFQSSQFGGGSGYQISQGGGSYQSGQSSNGGGDFRPGQYYPPGVNGAGPSCVCQAWTKPALPEKPGKKPSDEKLSAAAEGPTRGSQGAEDGGLDKPLNKDE